MSNRLDGWKEIAAYLKRSPRTAQRWERQMRLPIHRLKAAGGEVVYAIPAELDEWFRQSEARNEPVDLDEEANAAEAQPLAPATMAPSPEPAVLKPTPPRSSRRLLRIVALTVSSIALALVILGLTRQILGSHVTATAGESVLPPATTLPFSPALDAGPWPIQNHDARRSNQSDMRGPARPTSPRLLYDSPVPLYYAAPADGYGEPLAVTSDGKILLGTCGQLLALDSAGGQLWRVPLSERGFPIAVAGIAVDGGGQIIVASHACDDSLDARKVKLLAFSGTGSLKWTQTRAGMYLGPAIGIDRTVFQMDEFDDIHAYTNGMMIWTVDLPGYAQGAIALDSRGSLYVGTDGSTYGQPSLWSLDRAGKVRWSTGDKTYVTPVVSITDDVYGIDRNGTLHALDVNGRERWTLQTGAGVTSFEPLAVAASGNVYVRVADGITAVTADGRVRWHCDVPGASARLGPVLDAAENVYVAGDNQVVSISPAGTIRWTLPLSSPGRIVIGPDGSLVVFSAFHRLYAIRDIGAATGR